MAVVERKGKGIGVIDNLVKLLTNGEHEQVISEISDLVILPEDVVNYAYFSSDRYFRNCIYANDEVELILLCWDANQQTAIHCHDEKECFVKIVKGTIEEKQYTYDKKMERLVPGHTEVLTTGDTSFIDDGSIFHSLENLEDTRAMSLHMYMKPIEKCKVYDSTAGRFVEQSLSYDSYAGELVC